ncbi:indole-3-glycerol-phosphate synthase [Oceanidesulfovibrio indonesiensis]|uniref:indole-3-glycerol-phosphate synthase n=1 Tax=Oceanidesulfovibrio indonesiensis TaxID=54767 RepID=A0A7M3MF62_9BACT|nr:indole-3-glycerol-phosphate synthase [Oceanidesulfovibrio indonesiensis]TVM17647.1 indole-3-glycerol-phosphate synthase [Oceanidesulfovibrio indonesiensis]
MLEKFRLAKQPEVEALARLAETGQLPPPFAGARPSFLEALRAPGLTVIAEYKRASPSKGDIELGLEPEDVAKAYAEAGAGAISVLTETEHFKGDIAFLERMTAPGLPLLRKDFLIDPLQVRQTAATPASALLLIARMFEDYLALAAMKEQADAFGLDSVVEVFDEKDLDMAKKIGATIIQVNNRDLDRLTTDLAISEELASRKDSGETWVSASGMDAPEHLAQMKSLGFDAVLVGTSLMRGGDPGRALAMLTSEV